MADQKIFAEGMYWSRHERAPEWVIGRIGVDVDRAIKWLEKQPVSERGYLNLQICRGKNGKEYIELDLWQPSQSPTPDRRAQPEPEPIDLDGDIPF